MHRYRNIGIVALAAMAVWASSASADPNPDFSTPFTLDCGSAGSFTVAVHENAPAPKPVFVLDDTTIFRVSSLSIAEVNNGQPLFSAPGLFQSGVSQLTCHFIGAATGRHFTVTGFFTPAAD